MLCESWWGVGRTIAGGVLGYLGLVRSLRISGKRTLSTMDPFDFVVTAALGSALAHTIVSDKSPLIQGLVGFAVLIGLQRHWERET